MLTTVVLGAVLLLFLGLAVFGLRRRWLVRSGGAVEMSLRLNSKNLGRGWVLGMGRYVGDELQWFRVFSLSPRPRRVLNRRELVVAARRSPQGPESLALLKGMDVVVLAGIAPGADKRVEIALERRALTGFLAWLEAQPPGSRVFG